MLAIALNIFYLLIGLAFIGLKLGKLLSEIELDGLHRLHGLGLVSTSLELKCSYTVVDEVNLP